MIANPFRRITGAGIISGFALLALLYLSAAPSASTEQQPAQPLVMDLKLDGEVEPVLATYIDEGIAEAARRNASLVLITMDTPGGLSDSMKDIIQHILGSPVPVAVYVGPTGARGASAGFFILLSADVAAMAPGTRTGAASPIIAIGVLRSASTKRCAKKS
jgi:membrane-bound serine protease (ClpP class)